MDNKAFLLIRLKKYLNPHENSCSKVISILITGNIYHESSSAPQQHKSVQYKWFALYLHRDVSHTDMLQPHFISCSGGSGQEATCADPGIFVSFIKSSAYFTVYRGGPMVLLLRKIYLYFSKDPEGHHYYPGVVQLLPRGGGGPNSYFYRNPYTYLLFSRGEGCTDPLSPSGSAHGQCHHNRTIFITVPLLTMIVRHWFVRINDR